MNKSMDVKKILKWEKPNDTTVYSKNDRQDLFDFINELQDAAVKTNSMRVAEYKKRMKERIKDDNFKKLEETGAFDEENIALSKGFVLYLTDTHGDMYSLYTSLVNAGFLIPEKNKIIIEDYVNGETIYNGELPIDQKTLKFIQDNYPGEKIEQLAVIPGFRINPKFGGEIKLLGDYVDRGKESGMCLGFLSYLMNPKKAKNEIDDKSAQERYKFVKEHLEMFYGNHESFSCGTNALYAKNKNVKASIDRMRKERSMLLGSLKDLGNGKYVAYAHTLLCKKHVPKLFNALYKFSQLDSEIKKQKEDSKTRKIFQGQLDRYKKLLEDKAYAGLAEKIKKIDFKDFETLLVVDKFKELCEALKNKGFEEKDYFSLRNFVFEVMDDFGVEQNDENGGAVWQNDVKNFYGDTFDCIQGKDALTGYTFDVFERYRPEPDEIFETVTQVKGHDNVKKGMNPFIFGSKDKYNIISIDNMKSYGYRIYKDGEGLIEKEGANVKDKINVFNEEIQITKKNEKIKEMGKAINEFLAWYDTQEQKNLNLETLDPQNKLAIFSESMKKVILALLKAGEKEKIENLTLQASAGKLYLGLKSGKTGKLYSVEYGTVINPETKTENDEKGRDKSLSTMVIQCPDYVNKNNGPTDIENLFLIETFSVKRNWEDYSLDKASLKKEDTHVSYDNEEKEKIKKKDATEQQKKFNSLRKYFAAYSGDHLKLSDKKINLAEGKFDGDLFESGGKIGEIIENLKKEEAGTEEKTKSEEESTEGTDAEEKNKTEEKEEIKKAIKKCLDSETLKDNNTEDFYNSLVTSVKGTLIEKVITNSNDNEKDDKVEALLNYFSEKMKQFIADHNGNKALETNGKIDENKVRECIKKELNVSKYTKLIAGGSGAVGGAATCGFAVLVAFGLVNPFTILPAAAATLGGFGWLLIDYCVKNYRKDKAFGVYVDDKGELLNEEDKSSKTTKKKVNVFDVVKKASDDIIKNKKGKEIGK